MTETIASPSGKKRIRTPRSELISERLVKDEKIIVNGIVSGGIYWKAIAVAILAVIFAIFVARELGLFLLLVAVIMAVYAIIMKEILLLVVTNKRILVRYGILQVDIVDIHFDKVESIELARMPPGYLLGYSNVIIMGTGSRVIVMPYFENGVAIRKAYNEMTLNHRDELPPTPVVIVDEKP